MASTSRRARRDVGDKEHVDVVEWTLPGGGGRAGSPRRAVSVVVLVGGRCWIDAAGGLTPCYRAKLQCTGSRKACNEAGGGGLYPGACPVPVRCLWWEMTAGREDFKGASTPAMIVARVCVTGEDERGSFMAGRGVS